MEDSCVSSPDPLANSTQTAPPTEGIIRRKSARLAPVKTPLPPTTRATSRAPSETSTAQTVQLQNFVFDTPQGHRSRSSSPTKSNIKTESHLSPWRIRVTVEAERDDNDDSGDIGHRMGVDPELKENTDSGSPTKGRVTRRTRTTTTKVPVKGLESSPPAPKRRGRPKKSETPARPRNGTPVPKTRGRRKTAGDVTNGEDTEDPGPPTPKPTRARSKKGHVEAEEHNDDARENTVLVAPPLPVRAKTPAGKRRTKKSESPIKIAIDRGVPEDVPETGTTEKTRSSAGYVDGIPGNLPPSDAPPALADLPVNSLTTLEIVRPEVLVRTSDGSLGNQLDVPIGNLGPEKWNLTKPKLRKRDVSAGATPARFSPIDNLADETRSESPVVVSGDEPVAGDPGYATTSEHPPADIYDMDYSVLESEGFSMVSISSIPSMGGTMGSPTPQESHHDDMECDLVLSFTGMNLESTQDKSIQHHGYLTQEEVWQLERDEVSRRIEMMDPNQVITIDSDNESSTLDEDRGSINEESFIDPGIEYQIRRDRFLRDQERLLQEDCLHSSNLELQKSTNLDDLFSNEDPKPRRGKIPSPWRAERQILYSGDAESGNESGWLPPLPLEDEGAGEEDEERELGAKGVERHADLSQLLGLKSSPATDSNGRDIPKGMSLRQRLIEKFYWAKQSEPQVEEPPKAKPMEASGRLILYPSLPNVSSPGEDIVPKYDGLPVTGLWGVGGLEPRVDRRRRWDRSEKRGVQKVQKAGGGSTPAEGMNVGTTLGSRTRDISPPDSFAIRDESLDNSFPTEERPLVLKLLSDKPGRDSEANASCSSALFSTITPTPPQPALQKIWTKHHWQLLNTLWLASKATRRLQHEKFPANPIKKTYTTGNLSFDCPGLRSLTLDDDEMVVVREFGLVMRKRLGVDADTEELFGEKGEFGEKKVAQRMYSMIVGEEERRKNGEVYDEWGRWVGYGESKKKKEVVAA